MRCAQILLILFYLVPAQCHNKMHCWVTSSQKCSHTYTVRRVDTLTIFPFAWMFCRVFCAVSNLRFGSSGISPKPWCSAHTQTSCLLWMSGYTVPLETEPWDEGRNKMACKNISGKRHWEPQTSFHICMWISKCADGGDQSDKRCKKERSDDITSSHVRAGDFWTPKRKLLILKLIHWNANSVKGWSANNVHSATSFEYLRGTRANRDFRKLGECILLVSEYSCRRLSQNASSVDVFRCSLTILSHNTLSESSLRMEAWWMHSSALSEWLLSQNVNDALHCSDTVYCCTCCLSPDTHTHNTTTGVGCAF